MMGWLAHTRHRSSESTHAIILFALADAESKAVAAVGDRGVGADMGAEW